jgi:hypothetical protein
LTSEEVGKPPDLTTLQTIVDRFAAETAMQYQEIKFSTGLMPIHGDSDVIAVDIGSGVLEKFTEHSWEADLRAGGAMSHVARRMVAV